MPKLIKSAIQDKLSTEHREWTKVQDRLVDQLASKRKKRLNEEASDEE